MCADAKSEDVMQFEGVAASRVENIMMQINGKSLGKGTMLQVEGQLQESGTWDLEIRNVPTVTHMTLLDKDLSPMETKPLVGTITMDEVIEIVGTQPL